MCVDEQVPAYQGMTRPSITPPEYPGIIPGARGPKKFCTGCTSSRCRFSLAACWPPARCDLLSRHVVVALITRFARCTITRFTSKSFGWNDCPTRSTSRARTRATWCSTLQILTCTRWLITCSPPSSCWMRTRRCLGGLLPLLFDPLLLILLPLSLFLLELAPLLLHACVLELAHSGTVYYACRYSGKGAARLLLLSISLGGCSPNLGTWWFKDRRCLGPRLTMKCEPTWWAWFPSLSIFHRGCLHPVGTTIRA